MKAFLERSAVVVDMRPGMLKRKVGASVAAARRGGALTAIDTMNHFFLNHEVFVVGSTYWNMAYGRWLRALSLLEPTQNSSIGATSNTQAV